MNENEWVEAEDVDRRVVLVLVVPSRAISFVHLHTKSAAKGDKIYF